MDRYRYTRALSRLVTDGIVVCDANGAILDADETAAQLLGITHPGSDKQVLREVIGGAAWRNLAGYDFNETAPPYECEWRVSVADPGARLVKARITVEPGEMPGSVNYICLIKDISSQHAAEKELRRHQVWEKSDDPNLLGDLTELLHRYRLMFETMGEGIVGVENQDVPRFNLANSAAERLFGVGPGELIGRKLTDFTVQQEYQVLDDQLEKRKSGKISTYDMVLVRPDGEHRTIQVTGSPMLDDDGYFLGSFSLLLDVTDQRRYEIDLEQSRNLLAHAHRLINLGTWEWDLATGAVRWSDELFRLFGYEPQSFELDIEKVLSFYPEDTRDISQKLITSTVENHESGEYEQVFFRADGEARILHSTFEGEYGPDGEVTRIIGTVQDITERRKAEEELRAKEARIQSIFRAAPTGIGVTVNREFREVNERLCEMTGYSADELIGRSSRIIYPTLEEYERAGTEKYRQIKLKGTGTVETRWVRKDGSEIDVLLSSTPLDPDDTGKGITFTALDITERIAGEKARLNLERQVQQSQKLESLGVLAGGIAHDFNNLLMTILGNADLALLDLVEASPARESIVAVTTAAQRAAGLARQMLAYSGKGKFVIESIEINSIVREMADLLEVSISKKASLSYNFAAGIPCFEGDANQIRQVIMNLITNASDALGAEPGTIKLSTGKLRCTKEYLSTAENFIQGAGDEQLAEGEYVFFEVSDSGPGMDTATKTKIFEPFFTTKFTGRGLGLAAVLGIINSHHGAIQVYSEPGQGSVFKVLLPVATDAAPAQTRRPARAPGKDWRGSGLVLIADDDQSVLRVSEQMYKLMGFEVVTATDGRQAVETFRLHAGQVVMVQLDLTMPEMGGEEAFTELRALKPGVKVLLSSGYNQQEATQRFTSEGLAGFIQKPFTFGELQSAVRSVVEENS